MRWTRAFIRTVKETPKDAVLPSHQLLLRGGFISSSAAGIYDYMPLGKRVLDKIRFIVKDELDKAGCEEVSLGFVTPSELWQESGRFFKYGKELLRFKDRKEGEFVLGPTHEEAMVNLVRGRVTSYKQLPLNLYQINLKFRDEARPRFGLMRGREFLMKDGYSFHASYEDMSREFNLMEETYKRIFKRVGIDFRVVEADSGAIGGSGSKEFMALTDSGEDTILSCEKCEYGANVEAAKRVKPIYPPFSDNRKGEIKTPDVTSIANLAEFLKIPEYKTIKAIVKKALFDNGEKIAIFFIRGSDILEETKALNAVNANELIDPSNAELEKYEIVTGFIGVGYKRSEVLTIVDRELENEVDMIGGANKKDTHIFGVNIGSDHTFADLIAAQEGDSCPVCGAKLKGRSGIEIGHIFQLGDRYSKPLNAAFLDENGKAKNFIMGTYGIGVSRLIAAVIEANRDEKGCVWNDKIAPYLIDIVVGSLKDKAQKTLAENLYSQLLHEGYETILDDRDVGFGVKMNDFELLGFPYAIIVGKNATENRIEIVDRKSGERELISADRIINWLKERV
ncbi:MAG: proline--tRNA ligase [Helicobacteraceae bacterium]|nr:proline--tRNA ligase [Helicobacteraceae bacterium]